MKRELYNSVPRYKKVLEKMDMLGITDVSTLRQSKNATIVWRLPIKYGPDKFIEVASFATGYVRNQNCGYSNYQLNKRHESKPQYYKLANGDFREYNTRSCKLIPNEIDRLEYLIGYCLKNYYIKNANEVANGGYVTKWEHEYAINRLQNKLANSVPKWKYDEAMSLSGVDRIYELESQVDAGDTRIINLKLQNEVLENKLSNAISATKYECVKGRTQCLENTIKNLQNKLETISHRSEVTKSIADNG